MQFDRIPKGERIQMYLETAFNRGRTAAARVKGIKERDVLLKAKERDRMRAITTSLTKSLQKLHDSYPSFDQLGEFTIRVFSLDMDPGRVKQALGGVHSAVDRLQAVTKDQIPLMSRTRKVEEVKKVRDAFIGRIQSVLKQTEKHINVMNEARVVFRKLPVVDESLFTVAIAGFPNVGKSTLLRKLTTATPEIKAYAFTTKGLNVGYFTFKYNKIQCIDTPGTLNRKDMNAIEMKADIALRYLATAIVYVFDPTESYALEKQRELYEKTLELDKDIIVYVSKTDIASSESVANVLEIVPDAFTDAKDIRAAITSAFKEWV